MKRLLLERKASGIKETEGFLTLAGVGLLATIERPWVDSVTPGGKPFVSCVPAGTYDLIPHTRPDGAEVVALVNPGTGVYYQQDDMPAAGGRFLILCHVATWAHELNCCIAPGKWHADNPQGRMVKSSGASMRAVMKYIAGEDAQLEIRWI